MRATGLSGRAHLFFVSKKLGPPSPKLGPPYLWTNTFKNWYTVTGKRVSTFSLAGYMGDSLLPRLKGIKCHSFFQRQSGSYNP